ncbi:MAG: hypothetical protein OYH76_22685 [Defluviicoccus sp.]|nr:hypothetical protein [Defluviicoccus sp.]MDE0278712.1 hypothetical protein [Defluviicoccus sp.]
MRQPLKQPHEMFDPDPRNTSFARLDATGPHSKTVEEHYRDVAAIRLSARVPAAIRHEFDTVRNLYLYSWYVYDFTVAADLYAYALMERTIKEKCLRADVPLKGEKGLKKLLKLCIRQGWLTNADFELAVALTHTELVFPAGESEPPVLRSTPRYRPSDTDFCEQLAESLSQIRNMGAHGEAGLGLPASTLRTIEICRCIANALFRDHGLTAEPDSEPVPTVG